MLDEPLKLGEATCTLRYLGGERKINAIKLVRELTRLGLRDAKQVVDEQLVFMRGVGHADAERIGGRFAEIGAQVELIPEYEQLFAFDPEHPLRGDQPVERLRWSGREIAWERRVAGAWQREREREFASREELEQLVAEQLDDWAQRGLEPTKHAIDVVTRTSAREPQLEQELRTGARPREVAAVYSDWLQQRGDPRGDLIALALEADARPEDRARLDQAFAQALVERRDHLFGPLEDPRRYVALDWQLGLVSEITLAPDRERQGRWPAGDRQLLELLLALPVCACVRALHSDSNAIIDPELWAGLAARDPAQLAGLRELALRGYSPLAQARFDWAWVPRLERLELILHDALALELAELRELIVLPSGIGPLLATLRESTLPRLELLSVSIDWLFTDEDWDATDYLGEARPQLAELVRLAKLAALRSLRLTSTVELEDGEFPTDSEDPIPHALLVALLGAGLDGVEIDVREARLSDRTWTWLRDAAPRHANLRLP